ncbi:MAG: hypothetical protein Ta2E_05590 [Mycoplasmoidaceae bacterium]|nr:MAG: hypothetical protein Ta2E_05590 [Mycoplasmoidaceae bacterium]
MEKPSEFKIDLVYTWCDGTDPGFQAKKAKAMGTEFTFNGELNGKHHILQADELMYSLRSIEKNLPWINNIWIIVDEQIPDFLNIDNPKIHIVDMKDIFPSDALPNFNTNSIETVMGNIKGLSEYFILASDDMMVNKPLSPDYFYTKEKKPIIRVAKMWCGIFDLYSLQSYTANYENNKKVEKTCIQDCHNMTAHVKTDYNDIIENSSYKYLFKHTIYSKFRSYYCIQRIFIYFLLGKQNKVVFKYLGNNVFSTKRHKDQLYCESSYKWIVNLFNPNLFCMNASKHQKSKEIKKVRKFLNKKFPNKSQFEK